MKFEGEIGELDLLSQLVELGREGFTGAFRFESDSVIKIIYLKQGDILSASTNDRTDSIDEILLKAGKVTKEHVRQALAKRKETETLGDALLSLGFITRKELTWARRVQLIGIIRSIQKWSEGSWTLVADYLPKREEGTVFPLRQVILELVLTEQGREKLDRDIASGEAVFARTGLFTEEYPSLGLNQEADGIVQSIDGQRTAAEIAATAPTDEFNVYKLLRALTVLGLIARATEPQVEPEVSLPPPMNDFDLDFSESSFPASEEPRFDDGSTVPAAAIPGFTEEVDLREVAIVDAPEADTPPAQGEISESPRSLGTAAVAPAAMAAAVPPRYSFEDQPILAEEPSVSPGAIVPPEPRLRPSQAPRAKATVSMPLSQSRRRSRLPLIASLVVLVLAAGAFALWKYFFQPMQEPAAVVRTASTKTRTSTPAHPASAPAASPAPATGQVPTQSTSVPLSSTTAPTTSPAPAITETSPASPAAKVVEQPAPVVAKPVAVVPVPTSAAQGKYAEMARKWAEAPGTGFTVQFELVCRPESVAKALSIGGSNIWFVPTSYRGNSCYRVFWGRYPTQREAEQGAGQIPQALRESKPTVISVQNLAK